MTALVDRPGLRLVVSFVGLLLAAMLGVGANVTLGFATKRFNSLLLFVVPLTVAISAFLIADIDSPRGGVVQVAPENLTRLAKSLNAP
jgi:uncharacterized membrane protein (Fun14 family)